MADRWKCPEAVGQHDTGGRTDGRCTWCLAQVGSPGPRPGLPRGHVTEMDQEYRRFYDPDYGTRETDL